MDLIEIKKYLLNANEAGYASNNIREWIREKDKSTTIAFQDGEWRSHDNFFGGEPYSGRYVVFHKEQPVWIMVYYGMIDESITKFDDVYAFLRTVLKNMPEDLPLRGPEKFQEGEYRYETNVTGNLAEYTGHEKIFFKEKEIYHATYLGGLVDVRHEEFQE